MKKLFLALTICVFPMCAMSRESPDEQVKKAREVIVIGNRYDRKIDYEALGLAALHHAKDSKLAFSVWEFLAKEGREKESTLFHLQGILDDGDIAMDDPERGNYESRFQALLSKGAYKKDLSTLGLLLFKNEQYEKAAYVALLEAPRAELGKTDDGGAWTKKCLAKAHKKDSEFFARLRTLIDQAEEQAKADEQAK